MPLSNAGRDQIAGALIAAAGLIDFTTSTAYIGVGDDDAVFSAAHTDLQGTNKLRRGMDSSAYPNRPTPNQLQFRATFETGVAVWDWQEWGVFNDPDNGQGVILNRKPESPSLGSKPSGESWQITVTLDIELV